MSDTFGAATAERSNLFAVVMAGGPGARLWPESRRERPKPFLPLTPEGRALCAATIDRLDELVAPSRRYIVASRRCSAALDASVPREKYGRALLEPVGRETAPCVAWGALVAASIDPDATLVVLPSDHWISPVDAFRATIRRAVALVEEDPTRLATLGIRPLEASSAYGYIERGAPLPSDPEAFQVAVFREKPDPETARRYVASGRFFWNAGIFVWKARRILELIRRFEPESAEPLDAMARLISEGISSGALDRVFESDVFASAFVRLPKISIDRAVLQRAESVVAIPVDSFRWSDVGSFSEMRRLGIPSSGNFVLWEGTGGAEPVEVDPSTSKNYVRVTSDAPLQRRRVVALGSVENLKIVDSGDSIEISRRMEKDWAGDSKSGDVDVVALNGANLYLTAATSDNKLERGSRRYTFRDVEGLLVVDAGDALLITQFGDENSIKALVEELGNRGLDEFL